MSSIDRLCGNLFNGLYTLSGEMEILVEGNRITKVGPSVVRPPGAGFIDISERRLSLGPLIPNTGIWISAAAELLASRIWLSFPLGIRRHGRRIGAPNESCRP